MYSKRIAGTLAERFWAKVRRTASCWEWTAAKHPAGYGVFGIGSKRISYAHRFAYEQLVGPVPEGKTLDHLCRNRACVNPAHLEPISNHENILRGESPAARFARRSHCANGHEFTDANTYMRGTTRCCRDCKRNYDRERRPRRKAA